MKSSCSKLGLLSLTVLLLASTNPAEAASQRGLRTRLKAAAGVTTSAKGDARRQTQRNKRQLLNDRLSIAVKVPVPSAVPTVADAAAAQALALTASLSRGGTAFANCSLAFDGIETKTSSTGEVSTSARYALHLELKVRKGRSTLRARKGSCDTDLATEGAQVGIPDIKADDVISISGPDTFLEGEF